MNYYICGSHAYESVFAFNTHGDHTVPKQITFGLMSQQLSWVCVNFAPLLLLKNLRSREVVFINEEFKE